MRVTADVADKLIADFTAWINKQVGEDLHVLEHADLFSAALLRQAKHVPHPCAPGGVIRLGETHAV